MSFLEFADVFRKSYEQASEGHKPDAAWLGDPTDRHESRYWDGQHWTGSVADQGRQSTDPADLAQDGADWRECFENETIAALRLPVLTQRFGVTELGDVHLVPVDEADRVRVELAASAPCKGGRPLF